MSIISSARSFSFFSQVGPKTRAQYTFRTNNNLFIRPSRNFSSAAFTPKFSSIFAPRVPTVNFNFQYKPLSISKCSFTEDVREPYLTHANVFVSNLPFTVSPQDIRESFRQFGYVIRINLLKNPQGNPNGKAIVEFGNEESGASLVNNPPIIDGRQAVVRAFRSSVPILSETRVILSNVPYKTTENDLSSELSSYGNVVEMKFIKTAIGRFKGIVAITFDSPESAARFLQEKNNSLYNDRTLYVRHDTLRRDERLKPDEEFN